MRNFLEKEIMEENHVDVNPPVADSGCEFCEAYFQLDEDYKSKVIRFMINCKMLQDIRRNNKKFKD